MGRATVNSIEPYMYVAYMLNFSDNISIERAVKMSKDKKTKVEWKGNDGWIHTYPAATIIKWRVENHLKDFWNAQGLKVFSDAKEVFEFFGKHCKDKPGWLARLREWFMQ